MRLNVLGIAESSASCGIMEVYGFPTINQFNYPVGSFSYNQILKNKTNALEELKALSFKTELDEDFDDVDDEHYYCDRPTSEVRCAMLLVSLADYQWEEWEKPLLEAGFKQVGGVVVNPNTGNKIKLYFKQRST